MKSYKTNRGDCFTCLLMILSGVINLFKGSDDKTHAAYSPRRAS